MKSELLSLKVEGMVCNHCEEVIRETIRDIDGISCVKVNLKQRNVSLQYNPQKVDSITIKNMIKKKGYQLLNEAEIPWFYQI